MAIITFYPLLYQVWMSFTDYDIQSLNPNSAVYRTPVVVGIQNYVDILGGNLKILIPNFHFGRLLSFNLIWTATNVVAHIILGIAIALLLNIHGIRFKKFYRAIYVLPIVIPSLVIAMVWRNMYDPDFGAVNQALAAIGSLFGADPEAFAIRWIDQVQAPINIFGLTLPLSFFAALFTNIWLGWPFMTIVATGALQSVPVDLYEAAAIDGASRWRQITNITLPLIRPAMVPAAMYGIILTFNQFNMIYFVSGGGPLRQTEIMVTTAYRLVNEQREYGLAAAFSVMIFIVLLTLTLLTNRVTKATESYDV
jgi:arabinogalactan oligomer/maltooligosaccharide transport system permease protein